MKNFLYGSTALIAVGLMAGPVAAQTAMPAKTAAAPLVLNITGYYSAWVGVGKQSEFYQQSVAGTGANGSTTIGAAAAASPAVDTTSNQTGAGRRNHGFLREGEIHFAGQTVMDNGTKVGMRVELEAQGFSDVAPNDPSTAGVAQTATAGNGTTRQSAASSGITSNLIDESFLYFDGVYGRLEAGATWGPAMKMYYGPYNPLPTFGGTLNNLSFISSPVGNYAGLTGTQQVTAFNTMNTASERQDKIAIYTPRVYGVQFGFAYSPEGGNGARQGRGGLAIKDTNGQQSQISEYGLNYVEKFGAVDLGLYGSLAMAKVEQGIANMSNLQNDDYKSWATGANVKAYGAEVGAAWRWDNRGKKNPTVDNKEWEVGAGYTTGPISFGASWAQRKAEGSDATVATTGVTSITGGQSSSHVDKLVFQQVGGSYNLGPGIDLISGVQWWKFTTGCNVGAADCSATSALNKATRENNAVVFVFGSRLKF